MLARRLLASRGHAPFAADAPVEMAAGLLAAEARARAREAWRGLATATGLVMAALLLLASAILRSVAGGADPALLGLEVLASLGAAAWGFVLVGPAADGHGRAAALRAALRHSDGLARAFRMGMLLQAPARPGG